MTEAEFVDWCNAGERHRGEWVDGRVEPMHAVDFNHAATFQFLYPLATMFVDKHRLGQVLSEPYQIRLPRQRRRRSPDFFFVAADREHLLQRRQCKGPPDLIVEIVSPESQSRDRRTKFLEYEAGGVREYWLADRPSWSFEGYALGANRRFEPLPVEDGRVYSTVLSGLFFRPDWVWQLRYPAIDAVLKQATRERRRRLGAG